MVNLKPVFILNEIDFSPILKEVASMEVSYEKREGPNGGPMKDGSITVDILAWKAIITVQTKGIAAEWIPRLLNEIIADYVDITFIDPRTNTRRTGTFIPSVMQVPMAYFDDGDIKWYNATTITFTER